MVKGAAIEAVLLLRQCPPSIAENFAVAVRDISTVFVEKQHELLARASAAPLKLPPALLLPNARDFPTSRKWKMTGHEAAIQEEIDAAVWRRREAIEAEAEYNDRRHYTEQAVRDIIEGHSQRQEPLPSPPPSHWLSPPFPSPALPSMSSSSSSDSESPHKSQPRRGVQRTRKLVDNGQTAKDMAVLKGEKGKGKGPMRRRRVRRWRHS